MTRRTLVGIELFLALNALGGAIYAFGGAEGVDRGWLDGTPFRDYVVPGVILLVVVGGSLTLAATALLRRHPHQREISLAAAAILAAWILVQVLVIGLVSWMQPTVLGLALAIGWLAFRLPEPSSARTRASAPSAATSRASTAAR